MIELYWILTLLGFLYSIGSTIFIVKVLFKLEDRISKLEELFFEKRVSKTEIKPNQIEDSVANGLVKGLQAIREEDDRHLKLLEMGRKLQRTPLSPMNQNSFGPERIDTGGDLIPTNLSKEEQEILKMYYDRRNEV